MFKSALLFFLTATFAVILFLGNTNYAVAREPICPGYGCEQGEDCITCPQDCGTCEGGPYSGRIGNPALGPGLKTLLYTGTGIEFFALLLPRLITATLIVGSIIFFFMLLIGGIQWIMAGGDKASIEAARGRITSALIGLVVLFSTFAIIVVVENFFGISILTIDIGSLIIK